MPRPLSRFPTGLIPRLALTAGLAACAAGGSSARVIPLADGPRALTPDQQIRHVLNRLAFGPRPSDYERIRQIGIDRWVGEQLAPGSINDALTDSVLATIPFINQQPLALAQIYGTASDIRKAGGANPDTVALRMASQNSYRILTALRTSRVARATLTNRQLQEVLTDFWENHFSISGEDGPERYMLVDYDRRIRAHAMGKFRDLLGAVVHSPAMLFYLDNWQSKADSGNVTLAEVENAEKARVAMENYEQRQAIVRVDAAGHVTHPYARERRPAPYHPAVRHGRGLNENYGRELLELHTLGVDGGYTQHDVIEVARILTGWTIRDPNRAGEAIFRPDMHDAGSKVVMGHHFPAGRGEDEGEALLDMLAQHPSTAHFIAFKLVRHFVSDSPPPALVDRAAATFRRTDGDIAAVMRTIIGSPEFFSPAAYRAKVKSPFEVVVSTLRAMDAIPDTSSRWAGTVAYLGERLYGHLTPEGYPDIGDAWLNTGSILTRINFGYQIGMGQFPGVSVRTWPLTPSLQTVPRPQQVEGIVQALFGGDVSPDTRKILDEGTNPMAGITPPRNAKSGLPDLLGLSFGAPEFERR